MPDAPLVSVVLPTRNRAATLARAIDSVLCQTHGDLELLVVDDGSSDETPRVLERYGDRIRTLRQAPAGAYAARNRGLSQARGELIAFIDSDDAWRADRLAAQLPLLGRRQVGLVFGDVEHVGTRRSSFQLTPPRRGRVAPHFARGNFVPTISVLVRRSCLDEVGGFPTSHSASADYLTWFRIARRHELDFVPHVVADYTVHGERISGDLGHSLAARLDLFGAELEATPDPVLERLVFNLGLQLALAIVRGRARSVPDAWSRVRAALRLGSLREAAAFAADQALRRARRLAA